MPSIPLKSGKLSDTGYRFRKNKFDRNDEWFPFIGLSVETFYDLVFFNSDTVDVPKDNALIATMFFRLATDEIEHRRTVK